jgi:hypothetical protein
MVTVCAAAPRVKRLAKVITRNLVKEEKWSTDLIICFV